MPRVSVIMGIYNCSSTLVEAMNSLYAQTFQDFEIILCEDGSNDDTYAIAEQNANSHKNIVLLKNEKNMGLNATLNKCLSVASGEYIARMDGDDISLPTRFEKEVAFLDAHPEYAIVSTPMIYFDDNGEFYRGKGDNEPQKQDFINSSPFCHAPCMVRKSAYDAVNGYSVSPKLLRHEDYNLWMKMYATGLRGYNLGEHLYAMRDDRNAVKRRTLRGRLNGIYAHWLAYKTLKFSFWGFLKFAIRSLMIGLMPMKLYSYFHRNRNKYVNVS